MEELGQPEVPGHSSPARGGYSNQRKIGLEGRARGETRPAGGDGAHQPV